MVTINWQSFEYWEKVWKKMYKNGKPFRSKPLTRNTVFVYQRVTESAGFCMDEIQQWHWFPEPKAVIGYLRFIVVPQFFISLFDYSEADPKNLAHVEKILNEAKGSEYYPLMKTIVQKLDSLFDTPEDKVIIGLKKIADLFHPESGVTLGSEYQIQIFSSPIEVGEKIAKRKEEEIMQSIDEFGLPDMMDFLTDDEEIDHDRYNKECARIKREREKSKDFKKMKLRESKKFAAWRSSLLNTCAKALTDEQSQRKILRILKKMDE